MRDGGPKQEERLGILEFKVFSNDGSRENVVALTTLKDIFSKQLPKMPVDYIARLVLDKNHKALAIIKNKNIIGGIQFRPFKDRGFIEIVFCAIMVTEQVRGYGTYLMNHLKKYAKSEGIYHFLTYADNFAVGYFKKQGFSHEITLDREYWGGVIKDYDGGTMMHCHFDPNIDYMEIPNIIRQQRYALLDKLKQVSIQHIKWKGLKDFKLGNRRISLENLSPLIDCGWNPEPYKQLVSPEVQKTIYLLNKEMLELFKNDKDAWPFLVPVDKNDVKDYYDVIKNPVDLQTMEKKLEEGFYITQEMFIADLYRMLENCRHYNPKDSVYYEVSLILENRYLKKWKPTPII